MSVLVAHASRHGATRELAEHIAGVLVDSGAAAGMDLGSYDAAAVDSAAYAGRWLKDSVAAG